MKVSLIIPTSNRAHMLATTLESIRVNTSCPEKLEILIIADEEDPATQTYVNDLVAKYRVLGCRLLVRPHSDMLNRDYYNWAADQAIGDLLWVFADDLVMCAPDWDTVVEREVASFTTKYPDRVFCVSMKDNTPPPSHRLPKFPCFPMFTREARAALGGWILHPKPPNWGVDYINFCIFHPLERMLEIHDRNYLNHVSYHTKQVESDETAKRIGSIFNALKMVPHHNTDRILSEEVPNIRLGLLEYINQLTHKQETV